MSRPNFKLYDAAKAADDALHIELVRVYGKDACNARYKCNHLDAGVNAAKEVKLTADLAWRAEMLKNA